MVLGMESFKQWFMEYADQYIIIGGTACDLLMEENGLDFRATRDIDMVLIIESLTPEFAMKFWEYVKAADYKHIRKSSGTPQFYRFSNPVSYDYPQMIELFTGRTDIIKTSDNAVLTPLHIDDEISSLSAILMDRDYYQFLRDGRQVLDSLSILDVGHLIPFKAKAWIDLTHRQKNGEHVDGKNIRKHKNDVFRLSMILTAETKIDLPVSIRRDLEDFLSAMEDEQVDLKAFGIYRQTRKDIINKLKTIYNIMHG